MGVSCDDVSNPTDYPCTLGAAVPWCAPGTAPVKSPCGIFSGGYQTNGRDMRDLPAAPAAEWVAGSSAAVAWAITANHGGGYAYRLCPRDADDLDEDCFQAGHLAFEGETQDLVDPSGAVVATVVAARTSEGTHPAGSTWARNPFPMEVGGAAPRGLPAYAAGRGPFNLSVVDRVAVPSDLPPGSYVLSWRWDAEQTKQVWSQCGDVHVVAAAAAAAAAPPPPPPLVGQPGAVRRGALPSGRRRLCDGASLGLDVGDCDAWGDLADALGVDSWPPDWAASCAAAAQAAGGAPPADPASYNPIRSDPCGCSPVWQTSVVCGATARDLRRITEVYLMGPEVSGALPPSAGNLTALAALSLVGTQLTGTVPEAVAALPSLSMVWLDHNPSLGGAVPASFGGRGGASGLAPLTAFELHMSNFSGRLPEDIDYAGIPDCALNGPQTFACPLPPGAETCGATCE